MQNMWFIIAPLLVVSASLVFRLIRYATTPWLKKTGFYTYYNAMFFTMPFGRRTLELHLGTTWDFFRQTNITPKKMLVNLITGLVSMIEAVEQGELSVDNRLRATMYFLQPETLKKFGFSVRPMYVQEYIVFLANYLEVCLLQSIVKRKVCLVKISSVTMVHIELADLVANKDAIVRLAEAFSGRNTENVQPQPANVSRQVAV